MTETPNEIPQEFTNNEDDSSVSPVPDIQAGAHEADSDQPEVDIEDLTGEEVEDPIFGEDGPPEPAEGPADEVLGADEMTESEAADDDPDYYGEDDV